MNTPKISVLLSCFNDASYLNNSIPSILNQTFKEFEFIIINDGSTDSTSDVINKYLKTDKRIRTINQDNIGLTKSLNKGIRIAKGKYVARIDADDISFKSRLQLQYNFLEKNKNIVLVGAQRTVKDFRNGANYREYHPLTAYEIRKTAIKSNPFFHSLVMYRKEIIEKIGLYDESFKYVQDYELWSRIIHEYETANLDEILGVKTINSTAISFRKDLRFERNLYSLKARYRNFERGNYSISSIRHLALPFYRVLKAIPLYKNFQ